MPVVLARGARIVVCLLALFISARPCSAQVVELKDGVERLASELTRSVPAARALRVVVTDFPDLEGVTSNLGRYVAERLTTRLSAQAGRFRVIERRRLGQVLAELKFSMSDLVDPAKARQLGRLLGAEAIIVGTLSDLGNSIDVDARVIEIETSNVLPGVTVAISKDDTVRRMLGEGRAAAPGGGGPPVSGPTPPGTKSPRASIHSGARWLKIDLLSVEIIEGMIKFFFSLTSSSDSEATWAVHEAENLNRTYMVDNLGNRYKLVGSSGIHERSGEIRLPPRAPVTQWVAFAAPEARASVVHVFLANYYGLGISFSNVTVPGR